LSDTATDKLKPFGNLFPKGFLFGPCLNIEKGICFRFFMVTIGMQKAC